jgi:hypothetical protein
MAQLRFAILAVSAFAVSGCTPSGPPPDLAGRWSRGAAACSAGIGPEFGRDSVDAVYAGERETLLTRPRYRARWEDGHYRVRIHYTAPSGAKAGARGELVLERRDDGWLVPIAHRRLNAWTGAQRIRLGRDPLLLHLTVRPCGPNSWIGGLRGREHATS